MNEKILLVDDETLLLDSLRRELSLQHYNIDTAVSGSDGLEKIADNGPYAVIVSDLRMPKMDGIKFLSQVMEIAPDTVRILLTDSTAKRIGQNISEMHSPHLARNLI
ncbi:MAG: response regulator [Chloroflexota bacterium]